MEVKEIGQAKTNKEIDEALNKIELHHIPITYYGYDGYFVPKDEIKNEQLFCGIAVTMSNKDCCIIYPHEILYIAIEDRKSVIYLTDRKIETHYPIEHWKSVLDEESFAQPHYSYIVNLNYVDEVTKDFVILKCGNEKHSVYTSSRRLGAFKKAFLNLKR